MTAEAHAAAESVANAAIAGLGGGNADLPVAISIPGFAKGTTSAPDMFIAGEDGPELIVGAGGSTVYTADETSQILASARMPNGYDEAMNLINDLPMPKYRDIDTSGMPGMKQFDAEAPTAQSGMGDKRIVLDITGKGEIELSGVDEETVWDCVSPKLKDAFLGILRTEIYEEGDLSYAY